MRKIFATVCGLLGGLLTFVSISWAFYDHGGAGSDETNLAGWTGIIIGLLMAAFGVWLVVPE